MGTQPVEVEDIVVLIPGIMGSVLTGPQGDIWTISADALLNAISTGGGDLLKLALKGPGNVASPDGIKATSLFPDAHIIPGLWSIDGYTAIANTLRSTLTVAPGENYFEFPYDWRLDNRVAAKQLREASATWLSDWHAKGHPGAKLIIIAHSMGGLVARYFIECLEGWKDTCMLITFGTPYHGSVKALQFLIEGYQVKLLGIPVFDFSAMVRSFPSAYQLLPMYPCLDLGDGRGLVALTDVHQALPNIDSKMLADAIAFYGEMAAAVTKNKLQPEYSYEIHPIVGTEQNTELRASLSGSALATYSDYPPKTWQGDTTVPWISAHPLDDGTPEATATYYVECHGSLQNGSDVLVDVRNIIERRTAVPLGMGPAARSMTAMKAHMMAGFPVFTSSEPVPTPPSGISVHMAEMYAGDSVPINAQLQVDANAFVDINDVRSGDVVHRAVSMAAGPGRMYSATIQGLPSSVYRARVYSDDPSVRSATTLFVVVSDSSHEPLGQQGKGVQK